MSNQRIEEIQVQYMLGAHPSERVKLALAYKKAIDDALRAQKVCFNGGVFSIQAVESVLYPDSKKKSIEPQYIGDIAEILGGEENANEHGDRKLSNKEGVETKEGEEA